MKRYVVDASVAVKWFVGDAPDEGNISQALRLMESGATGDAIFIQPPHWVAEISAVLARRIPQLASDSIADLLLFDCIRILDTAPAYQRAIALSQAFNHHLFDTLYHAVALEENATLITADRRYYDKAESVGNIMMLKSFRS